jgi:hypothetical protein
LASNPVFSPSCSFLPNPDRLVLIRIHSAPGKRMRL